MLDEFDASTDLPEAQAYESTYTYVPGTYAGGKVHIIKVQIEDGFVITNATWNVTVKNREGMRTVAGFTWDQWSVFIQAIVIVATAIIGFTAFRRLRKKRTVLQDYMNQIDKLMKMRREDPIGSERNLLSVAENIETDFHVGEVEDLHYFLLDRQIKENLRDLRQDRINTYFSYLPLDLTSEIEKIIEDGKITENEYKSFLDILRHTDGITNKQKDAIKIQMKRWRFMDRNLEKKADELKSKSKGRRKEK
jgi:hypothetical protein